MERRLEALREVCRRGGRNYDEIEKSLEMQILVAPDLEGVRAKLSAMLALNPPESEDPQMTAFLSGKTDTPPEALTRMTIVGTPDLVADGDRIVPGPNEGSTESCSHAEQTAVPQPVYRLCWVRLLARVFRQDVTECPACGGKMKLIAALTEPLAIRTYLDGVGLASRGPPIAPPRPLPQIQFDYAG